MSKPRAAQMPFTIPALYGNRLSTAATDSARTTGQVTLIALTYLARLLADDPSAGSLVALRTLNSPLPEGSPQGSQNFCVGAVPDVVAVTDSAQQAIETEAGVRLTRSYVIRAAIMVFFAQPDVAIKRALGSPYPYQQPLLAS